MDPREGCCQRTSRRRKLPQSLGDYKDYVRFIIAFFVYNEGILMALNFAAIIGAVLFGMEQEQLIIFMIVVQIASIIGAYLAGFVGDKIGSSPVSSQ
ncbi:MAG: MFS transporter [Deltaproteobacteria bacterium]|nr:MFS transporter [Deltaproteobacteria bacterium]